MSFFKYFILLGLIPNVEKDNRQIMTTDRMNGTIYIAKNTNAWEAIYWPREDDSTTEDSARNITEYYKYDIINIILRHYKWFHVP